MFYFTCDRSLTQLMKRSAAWTHHAETLGNRAAVGLRYANGQYG